MSPDSKRTALTVDFDFFQPSFGHRSKRGPQYQ